MVMIMGTALLFLVGLQIVLLWRNYAVYKYRMALLDRVSTQSKRDVDAGNPWDWRYDELDAVSYDRMVVQFWRSCGSFYVRDPARTER